MGLLGRNRERIIVTAAAGLRGQVQALPVPPPCVPSKTHNATGPSTFLPPEPLTLLHWLHYGSPLYALGLAKATMGAQTGGLVSPGEVAWAAAGWTEDCSL